MTESLDLLNQSPDLLTPSGWGVVKFPKLDSLIETALANASLITKCESEADNALQVKAVADLDMLIGGIERARKKHKEPFLGACRQIDETAKKASEGLLLEKGRLVQLAKDHHLAARQLERELEAEKQRKLQEEAARMERERAVLQAKLDSAKTLAQSKKAAAAIESLQQQTARTLADIQSQPTALAPMADGQHWRDQWDWESVDAFGLAVRYGNRFVTVEVKRAELLAFINSADCPRKPSGEPDLIGVWKREARQTVRMKKEKAITI